MVIKNTDYDKVNNLSNKEEYAVNLITSIFEKYLNNAAADIFSLNSQYNESIEYYDKILKSDNKNINAYNNKGHALYNLGRYEEAIKCFDKVINIDSKNSIAHYGKAMSLLLLNKYREALVNLNNVNDDYLSSFDKEGALAFYFRKLICLNYSNNYKDAVYCCDKILELDNKYTYAYNGKGNALLKLGKYEEAIKCFDKVLELDDKNINAYNNKGNALLKLGKYEEAIECYNNALELDNKYTYAYNGKGHALYNLGRYEEAIECYNKLLELDDKNINAYYNKGNALYNLGKYEEAIECYNKALELDNKYTYAYNGKGNALSKLCRYEEAIGCFDKALKLDNKDIDSLKNKFEALEKLNNYKNIISCIDDILKIQNLFESDYIEELKLKKSDYLFFLEDYKRALKSYEELKTDDLKIKEKIIICFMKLNNFQKAQKYISKLIANNKNNELYYYRGICLFNTNKYQECIKDFDTVIDYEDSKFYKGLSLHYLGDNDEALSLITEYKNKNEEDYSKKYNKFKEVIDKILIQDDKSDSAEKTDN